jgi:hypothetical protein
MKRRVTLNLSDNILRRALEIAANSDRDLEHVLEEWIDRSADEIPMEAMSDREILALCNFEMNLVQTQELRHLLNADRAGNLSIDESTRMDELLQIYRRGIIRKARAMEVAKARGLLTRSAD